MATRVALLRAPTRTPRALDVDASRRARPIPPRARPPRRPLPTPRAPPDTERLPSWPRSRAPPRAGLGPSLLPSRPRSFQPVARAFASEGPPPTTTTARPPPTTALASAKPACSSARCPSARSRSNSSSPWKGAGRRVRFFEKEDLARALADAWLAKRDEAVLSRSARSWASPNPRARAALITLDVGANGGLVDFLIDSGATGALVSPKLREMIGDECREGAAIRGLGSMGRDGAAEDHHRRRERGGSPRSAGRRRHGPLRRGPPGRTSGVCSD